MWAIDVLSRVVHVGTAIVLAGGSAFLLLVLLPALRELTEPARETLSSAVTSRWKRFVHVGIALFLLSGFYNYFRAIPLHRGDGLYHALVGTKMLLAFVLFFLAAALVGRTAKLESIRRDRGKWLKVIVLLAVVIVAISGYVKVRGPAPSPVPGDPPTTALAVDHQEYNYR